MLDKVGSLQLRRSGQFIGSERQVRKDARPWLEIGEPVRGIVSIDGRPVYGARPKVLLPPSPLDRAPSWRVRVRRVGETDWNVDRNWDAAEVETSIDPFDSAEDPQLGSFEIVITGPLGADTRFVGFVAEGVCAEFDTQIRVPVAGGLTACTAEVQARVLSVTPIGPLAFKITDLEKVAEFASDEVVLPVAVRPPHVEIRTGEVGAPVPWRVTADACTPEDFVKNRFVAVRAPGIDRVAFGFISAAGQLEQVEEHVRRKQGGIFELRTERFADTARTHQSGRVVATLQTFDGPVDVTVLMIRPRQLASGVMLHSGILRFDGLAELDDLAAYVWPATAPWRPVRVLSVIEGSAQLPANLVDAGELRCQLFVDDPWVSVEPLAQPAKDAFRIGQAGWFRDGSSVQTKLSRFVAGAGPVPRGIGAIPEIWPVLSWMHADGQVDSASQLTKVLAEEPRKALEGLGNSTIPLHDKMSMLIRTELVNRSYASPETLNELHADPWFGCMVELADLPSLYQRRQKNRDERAETLGYLSDKGGELLIELLRSGKIDALHEGCFGRNVFRLASMPPDQVEGLMREVELIPGPLLHPDTRFTATYEAFSQRTAWMRSGWSESFATQTSFVLSPVRRASALAYDAISIRSDLLEGLDVSEHPWMLMSLQSLTLAFLARLEAHGRIPGQYLNFGMLMAWASLAKL